MGNIFGGGAIGLYLFLYLLPGILGSLVYEFVVEGEKRDLVDRVATALVLALVSYLSTPFTFGLAVAPSVDIKTDTPANVILEAFLQPRHLLVATCLSAAVGLALGVAQNHDWIYAALRRLKMTRKTGATDVWQQLFYRYPDRWISLEFKDGRRLVGWPRRFSSSGQSRAILLGDAIWYNSAEDGAVSEREVLGPGVYLQNFDEIVSMELLD